MKGRHNSLQQTEQKAKIQLPVRHCEVRHSQAYLHVCYTADEQELPRRRLDLNLLPHPLPAFISMLLGLGAELGTRADGGLPASLPLCYVVRVKAPGGFSESCFPHPQPHTSLWPITVDMKG